MYAACDASIKNVVIRYMCNSLKMRSGSLLFAKLCKSKYAVTMNSVPAETSLIVLIIRLDFDCVE